MLRPTLPRPMPAPRFSVLVALAVLALSGCRDAATPEPTPAPAPDVPTFTGEFALVDDGAEDSEFVVFREALQDIVVQRDTAALLGLVAPGARLSFGDDPGGPDGFRAMWFDGDPPDGEPVWDRLAHALTGGSVEEDGAVTVPFVIGLWPSDVDPFSNVAVLRPDAPTYDQPGGQEIARLSQIVLPILAPPLDGWQQVRLPNDRAAYVETTETYSPIGYRAVFWDDGDGWRLRSFLAGD